MSRNWNFKTSVVFTTVCERMTSIKNDLKPHRMPMDMQSQVGCVIGRDYPFPIVEHRIAYKSAQDTTFHAVSCTFRASFVTSTIDRFGAVPAGHLGERSRKLMPADTPDHGSHLKRIVRLFCEKPFTKTTRIRDLMSAVLSSKSLFAGVSPWSRRDLAGASAKRQIPKGYPSGAPRKAALQSLSSSPVNGRLSSWASVGLLHWNNDQTSDRSGLKEVSVSPSAAIGAEADSGDLGSGGGAQGQSSRRSRPPRRTHPIHLPRHVRRSCDE